MKGIYIMKRKIFVQVESFLFGDKVDKEYTDKIYIRWKQQRTLIFSGDQ